MGAFGGMQGRRESCSNFAAVADYGAFGGVNETLYFLIFFVHLDTS